MFVGFLWVSAVWVIHVDLFLCIESVAVQVLTTTVLNYYEGAEDSGPKVSPCPKLTLRVKRPRSENPSHAVMCVLQDLSSRYCGGTSQYWENLL